MITPASKFWKGSAPEPTPYNFEEQRGYVRTRVKNHGPRHRNGSEREKARRRRQIVRGQLKIAD